MPACHNESSETSISTSISQCLTRGVQVMPGFFLASATDQQHALLLHITTSPLVSSYISVDGCSRDSQNLFLYWMKNHNLHCFLKCTIILNGGSLVHRGSGSLYGTGTPWLPHQDRQHEDCGSPSDRNVCPLGPHIAYCHQHFAPSALLVINSDLRLLYLASLACSV